MLVEHRWIAKALTQKTLSTFGLLGAYHCTQRLAGRLRNFHPRSRIEYAGKLAADVGLTHLKGAVAVEVGTGWVPVVPMGLSLLGVRAVHSFDLSRHLMPELALQAAQQLRQCLEDLAQRSGADLSDLQERFKPFAASSSWDALAERIGFTYHAPVDVAGGSVALADVDIVYSNLVLEHVTPRALDAILAYSMRILRPGGLCWHNIDYTDHFSHTMKGLSAINFLRYGERFWSIVGQNDILYMNRLRRSDFLHAFERAGFVVQSVHDYRIPEDEMLPSAALSERFCRYSADDLRCAASQFVLRKPVLRKPS